MKKLYYLSLALLLVTAQIYSQFNPVYNWFQVPSGTTNNLNNNSGSYICGGNGTIIKTTNQGLSWLTLNSGSNGVINSIQHSISIVIAVGNSGLILRSTNEGTSWSTVNSGVTQNLYSLTKIGATMYAAVGAGGILLRTSNSGADWNPVSSGVTADMNAIAGTSIALSVGNGGNIIRSTNLGVSWTSVVSPTTQNLNGVDFSGNKSFAVGNNGTVIRSTDAGITWTAIVSGVSADLYSVDILSSNVFVSGNGIVLKSTDDGNSWITLSDSRLPVLIWKSVYAYSANEILIAGSGGSIYRKLLDSLYLPQYTFGGNNINTWIWNSGIFNQLKGATTNAAGFEWPTGSGKTAYFTTGLTTAAYVNGAVRMASASYTGELLPGFCVNGNYQYDSRFKLYRVDVDRPLDSDWVKWKDMVPFGAPFTDINNNGTYEPTIDKPGIKDAKQTLFICMTDANPNSHTIAEGFGGGSIPLGAEYHFTVWSYNSGVYADMLFFKWIVINKSQSSWDSTIFSLVSDPDLGFVDDDYIGCDTARNLAFCYNEDNEDLMYGLNPPACGTLFLNCSGSNSKMTSSVYTNNSSQGNPFCETDPGNITEAYNFMKGFKKDGTPWVIPGTNPPQVTKYCYTGDVETGNGWTEYTGKIANCGGSLVGQLISPVPPGDRRQLLNFNPNPGRINPGDSIVIMAAQIIARGTNHKNSVTLLKNMADAAKNLCQNGFVIGVNPVSSEVPLKYNLYQNYPNPFNPVTNIKFDIVNAGEVTVKIYDAVGREVTTLLNERLVPGSYSVDWNAGSFSSGVYFYNIKINGYSNTKKMVLLK